MKECTLKEAVEMCDENGGRFRHISGDIFYYISGTSVYSEIDKKPFRLDVADFSETWIYEPPKSVFQEWNDKTPVPFNTATESRKEGWNEFAETLEKWLIQTNHSDYQSYVTDKIEQLKEK